MDLRDPKMPSVCQRTDQSMERQMINQVFDPFRDRLSRDIRNDLSESLMHCLREQRLDPAREVANRYLAANLASCHRVYIDERLIRYAAVLDRLVPQAKDPLWQGLVLWDERLFFEVHEILEHAWLAAAGEEKAFLQAMIRAAGVYIKRENGFSAAAEKIAAKALPILEANRHRLAVYTDPQRLITALRSGNSEPPILLA